MPLLFGLHVLTLAGVAEMCLGLLLHIIGLGTSSWSIMKALSDTHAGLFVFCSPFTSCLSYGASATSKVEACQAFALIGMLCALTTLALTSFLIRKLRSKETFNVKLFLFAILGSAWAAGGSTLMSNIIWGAAVFDSNSENIGFSFVLTLIGGLTFVVGGTLIFFGSKRNIQYANVS